LTLYSITASPQAVSDRLGMMEQKPAKLVEPAPVQPALPATPKRPAWFRNLFNFRFFSGEQPKISPHAVVDPGAEIGEDVEIGPFCVIGPDVKIGKGCRLLNSVTIVGQTVIGENNIFFPNSVLGTAPQDKKYKGAPTRLEIGSRNAFREAVTVHVGTEKGGGVTNIGDDNLLMVNSHVAHDVRIGSHCVIANNVMIAGHVVVRDFVAMMGLVGIHHYTTIGEYAYLAAAARIHHDVPPFVKVDGADKVRGLNKRGMQRAGVPTDDIRAIDQAYRQLFLRRQKQSLSSVLEQFDTLNGLNPHVKSMVELLRRRSQSTKGRYLESLRECTAESPNGEAMPADKSASAPAVAAVPATPPVVAPTSAVN
jgi:UDP-N-acetylglucosamine acyltransferase